MRIDGKPVMCSEHKQPMPCTACAKRRRQTRAMERHTRALEDAHGPDAERGREVKEGATKAGRLRKGQRKVDHVTDDELQDQVQELQDQDESRTNACRRVGRRHGIPLSTMLRRTRTE